jgi:hypothetical protein
MAHTLQRICKPITAHGSPLAIEITYYLTEAAKKEAHQVAGLFSLIVILLE